MNRITFLAAASALVAGVTAVPTRAGPVPPLPQHLSGTGLYVAGASTSVRPENRPYSPQYPLWSDGATKRRWLYLPPGASIDASRANAWEFPPGTRLWKEFSHGRPVETRLIERLADGSWRFAAYVWNEDGTDAVLAPAAGIAALPVRGAPNGRYAIPAEADCRACHEGAAVPVLGVSALQLSPDRDPLAPHAETTGADALDLPRLVARGWLRNLAPALLANPPRIAAASAAERAALGYLHANCGHCHNDLGDAGPSVPVSLLLAQDVTAGAAGTGRIVRSAIDAPARYQPHGPQAAARAVVPGRADASVLALRMRSRDPRIQMPPLGTRIPDVEGLALVERWINQELHQLKEIRP